jgi:hypothetical protein
MTRDKKLEESKNYSSFYHNSFNAYDSNVSLNVPPLIEKKLGMEPRRSSGKAKKKKGKKSKYVD